jgi:dihydrofolate reductase
VFSFQFPVLGEQETSQPKTDSMILSFVVAASDNNVIGNNNELPWHLPNDLKFFKNTTWAMPVIMGRKTFESFGKPLSGRTNIVITTQKDWTTDGVIVANDLDSAIKAGAATDAKELFIIGGGKIYRDTFHQVDKIYITRVHAELEGDTFFPQINPDAWTLVSNLDFNPDEKHKYAYSFQLWKRSESGFTGLKDEQD